MSHRHSQLVFTDQSNMILMRNILLMEKRYFAQVHLSVSAIIILTIFLSFQFRCRVSFKWLQADLLRRENER